MNTKKMMASLLAGAATLVGTILPTPALASNNNQALNMMAMQMYMQQQANAQQQTILAQEQAQATYNAAQAAWAANTVPQTTVAYYAPQPYCAAPVYNQPVYAPVVRPVFNAIDHIAHDLNRDFGNHVEFRGRR